MPIRIDATVRRQEHHEGAYFTLEVEIPPEFPDVEPGQFVMVQPQPLRHPYLRRAFSVFDVHGDRGAGSARGLSVLGKVIGPGTESLFACRPDDRLSLLGPLGSGFALLEEGRAALVAGGVGSAALLLLARTLLERGRPFDVFYGGRASCDLVHADLFRDLAVRSGGSLFATTEVGAPNTIQGFVTVPLEQRLALQHYRKIYTCGPEALMARVAAIASAQGVAGQAALETPMGCGYGACLGCAVVRRDGSFALCCKDGPIFDLDQVQWSQ